MLDSSIITQLVAICGRDSVLTATEDLDSYSYDATATWSHAPEVVLLPHSAGQVSQVLKLANGRRVPVTPRGGGTNLSGGSIPVRGGIVLCANRMDRIVEVNKTALTATVEPGVVLHAFNDALTRQGLLYPPDPQSAQGCTVGGTVAENSGGPRCAKYGITKHYVLGLEVVLASGYIMKLGGKVPKNRTGYDLLTLFVGSEGTLGIITQVTLRLLPLPPAQRSMLAIFDDVVAAGRAVSNILARGIVPAKCEFVDNAVIRCLDKVMPDVLPADAGAVLLIQSDGIAEAVSVEIQQISEVCRSEGASSTRLARDQAEADALWKTRSAAVAAVFSASPTVLLEDATVPRDKIADFIRGCADIAARYRLTIPLVGHAADGNIHPSILADAKDPDVMSRAQKAADSIFSLALDLGGTISGEHGIGLEKKHFLTRALDPMALEIMKNTKKMLDPNNILNPGKIWPEEGS